MALLGYTTKDSYLRVEKVEIPAEGDRHVVAYFSLYENATKARRLFSFTVEIAVGFSHRDAQAEEMDTLDEGKVKGDRESFVLVKGKLYVARPGRDDKGNRKVDFDEEKGVVGAQILNVRDGFFYVLQPTGLWEKDEKRVTPGKFDGLFSVAALSGEGRNPFQAVYDYVRSLPDFAHTKDDK